MVAVTMVGDGRVSVEATCGSACGGAMAKAVGQGWDWGEDDAAAVDSGTMGKWSPT